MMTRAPEPVSGEPKTQVFISYSREDLAFADRLVATLAARGVQALIDRTEIYAFEDRWKRVEALIAQADTIMFVLSPDSLRPDSVAQKEVAFAASLTLISGLRQFSLSCSAMVGRCRPMANMDACER